MTLSLDFTHAAFATLLESLVRSGRSCSLFRNGLDDSRSMALRHDVDRFPARALSLARLEARSGCVATYFFRTRPHVFRPAIIAEIADMGHEIGYHYEDLVDTGGDAAKAWDQFRRNLDRLRAIVPVTSIAMHGRPFSPIDGRTLWRTYDYRAAGISCEAYLDIDWSGVFYFTDTGRQWNGSSNVRDHPSAGALASPTQPSTAALAAFVAASERPAVISAHPERWTAGSAGWAQVYAVDALTNVAKAVLRRPTA